MSFSRSHGILACTAMAAAALAAAPASAHSRFDRHNHHRHVAVVDAPFSRVETRRYARVAVDAPFASVRIGRGVHVRAPFVNLWVPR